MNFIPRSINSLSSLFDNWWVEKRFEKSTRKNNMSKMIAHTPKCRNQQSYEIELLLSTKSPDSCASRSEESRGVLGHEER